MNNPMSLMADAAKLSIPQLQLAIKNGSVPPYIGVPLLQQKVKESQQAKLAMAAQQPAQPPVAQNIMQQAQGVDALPSNLPQQGMAGGGIISFSEGGSYGSEDYDPTAMEQNYRTSANAQYQDYLHNKPEFGLGALTSNITQNQAAARIQANTRTPYDDAVKYYKSIGDITGTAQAQSKRSEWLKNPTNLMENARSATPATAQAAPAQAKPTGATAAATTATPKIDKDFKLGPTVGTSNRQSSSASRSGSASNVGSGGLGYPIEKYDTKFIDELKKGDMNPDTGKPYTRSELSAQRKQEFIDAGGDPELYKKQKEAAEKAGTKSESRRKADEAAPWFAASKAFSEAKPNEGILGLSGKAMAGYGSEARAISKEDEARDDVMRKELNQVALAQNAYSQAAAVGDREAMQKAKDRIDDSTKLLGTMGMKSTDMINEANKFGVEQANKLKVAQMQSADTRYAADKTDRKLDQVVAAIMKDNPTMTQSAAIKLAYEYTMPGFGASAQRDVASRRSTMTAELNKLTLGISRKPEDIARIKQLRAQLAALGTEDGAPEAAADTSKFTDRTKYQI